MNENTKMSSVGKIVGTHGIKGAVKVLPCTDNWDRFNELDRVFLSDRDKTVKAHIETYFKHKNIAVVKFKEWNNINSVKGYKDFEIQIPVSERPDLPKGSYYHDEIIGLNVYNDNGDYLGQIGDIYQTGSNDVYLLKSDDKDYLIPAIKEVIKQIDIADNKMVIKPIEGLLE